VLRQSEGGERDRLVYPRGGRRIAKSHDQPQKRLLPLTRGGKRRKATEKSPTAPSKKHPERPLIAERKRGRRSTIAEKKHNGKNMEGAERDGVVPQESAGSNWGEEKRTMSRKKRLHPQEEGAKQSAYAIQ